MAFAFLIGLPRRSRIELVKKIERLGYEFAWVTETRLVARCFHGPRSLRCGHQARSSYAQTYREFPDPRPCLDGDDAGHTRRRWRRGALFCGLGAYWDPLAWKQGIKRSKPVTQMRDFWWPSVGCSIQRNSLTRAIREIARHNVGSQARRRARAPSRSNSTSVPPAR